jgi:TolB protein
MGWLLASLLLAAGCSTSHRQATRSSPSTQPGSTSTAPSTSTAVVSGSPSTTVATLGAGQEGEISDVPWAQIGAGWFLTEWAPTPRTSGADVTPGNPAATVLFLVDPLGGRYRLATGGAVPNGDLVAWSGDGQRALFETRPGGGASPSFTVLDVETGAVDTFAIPSLAGADRMVDFTRPSGLALIADGVNVVSPAQALPVQRLDLGGVLQHSYPPIALASGYPATYVRIGFLYWPDGSQLLLASPLGWQVVTNDGRVVSSVSVPTGFASCSPLRWWATEEVIASCATWSGASSLWLVPIGTGTPRQLSSDNAALDAWQLPGGVYASVRGCVGTPCVGVAKVSPDGSAQPVDVAGPARGQSTDLLGTAGSRLGIFAQPYPSPDAGLLEWFDPATGLVTGLLGGSVNGGSVNQALLDQPAPAPANPVPNVVTASPHFPSPQAAMTYLAAAWNSGDIRDLDYVTNPAARSQLQAMHDEAVNLRLDHCDQRPQGDYICYFSHDYPPGTTTTLPRGVGQAVFLAGPALTPGWYMTVFQSCG